MIDEAAVRQEALEKLLVAETAQLACYEATERAMQALRIADATSSGDLEMGALQREIRTKKQIISVIKEMLE